MSWGAAAPTGRYARLRLSWLRGLAVHHSGSPHDRQESHEYCPARVQAVQRYHQRDKGWSDVAYHWLVCRHGVIFQGRPLEAVGAANGTVLANRTFLAVCVLGDSSDPAFELDPPLDAALRHVRSLVVALAPRARRVWPHLRFRVTDCPGQVLREWCRQFP